MAEHYSFFDPVEIEPGVFDREYNAQEFTDYFGDLITTGIMKGAFNQLEVTTNGTNMVSSIDTGVAFIEGKRYFNDSPLELTHDTETLGKSRIDRIVIRMSLSTEARYVRAFIKKGVASGNPVAPELTQTQDLYEISLAQVKIVGGQTYIGVNDVTDERGKDVICPWAGSRILPNFDNATLEELINKLTLEERIPATLNVEWRTGTGGINPPLTYYKDGFGFIHVEGAAITSQNTISTIFTLPVGYRPTSYRFTSDNISISPQGEVSMPSGFTAGTHKLSFNFRP